MDDPTSWVYRGPLIKGEHYDIRTHRQQRAERGFSDYDWWGFDGYLSFVIIGGLKKFIEDGNGYPGDLESIEEWNVILNKMIAGFEASEAMKNYDYPDGEFSEEIYKKFMDEKGAVYDEGLALFAKWYTHLWD